MSPRRLVTLALAALLSGVAVWFGKPASVAEAAPRVRTVTRWTWEELMSTRGPDPRGFVPPGYSTRYQAPECTTVEDCFDLATAGAWPLVDAEFSWSGGQLLVIHPAPNEAPRYPGQKSVLRAAYNRARRHFQTSNTRLSRLLTAETRSLRARTRATAVAPQNELLEVRARWDGDAGRLVVISWLRRGTVLSGPTTQTVCAPCIPGNSCACAEVATEGHVGSVTVGVAHRAVFDGAGRLVEEARYAPQTIASTNVARPPS